jgi:beta-aspartyl-peptidase (threonine type)
MVKPFIIGTHNSEKMLYVGAEILRNDGTAIDAVEEATKLVELNPEDTSVGLGGIPNLFGFQEMDASIMDGKTLRTGAIGAVKGFKHPISIARKIMEQAPHVMLVSEGAEHFARIMGCQEANLSTSKSKEIWETFVKNALHELPEKINSKPYILEYVNNQRLREWYDKLSDEYHGTVNIIARDIDGNIASAVSTSGTALKFPGRLGDSPLIGAGNYCDNRFGAVACTGRGELAIRASTARTIIHYMENGLSLKEACFRGMKDIHELKTPGSMNCIAIDSKGNAMSATTRQDRKSIHWYMDIDSKVPEERIGIYVRP